MKHTILLKNPLRSTSLLVGLLVAGLFAGPGFAQQNSPAQNKDPEAEFHMARMIYADTSGGRVGGSRRYGFGYRPGWWAIDYPEAETHFISGIRRLSRIDAADDSRHLQLSEDAIFDYPWLFVQQVGQWRLSQAETARLREYLLRGGFLVADDFHGEYEWQVFAEAMRRVFPDHAIVDLDTSHEVFHVLYDLDQLTQIPGQRHLYRAANGDIRAQLQGPQKWRGIYDEAGRLMVAINFNMDMGDAWEHADDPYYPEPMTALAYRFGLNYLVYAMTH
ncbi:MAG: DUF4159 domain-containing protein [Pseudomonadales bacterium]|nr:DUF4159 domain-containing protein [Pseudomonadales bacterium]